MQFCVCTGENTREKRGTGRSEFYTGAVMQRYHPTALLFPQSVWIVLDKRVTLEIQQGNSGNPARKGWGRIIPFLPVAYKSHGFWPKWDTVLSTYLTPGKSLPAIGKTLGLKLSLANLTKCCSDQTWKCFRAWQAIWHDLLSSLLSQVQPFY